MQVIEKNIFTQVSAEESANVNGGQNDLVDANAYFQFTTALGIGTAPLRETVSFLILLDVIDVGN